jgi:hypothetical protein
MATSKNRSQRGYWQDGKWVTEASLKQAGPTAGERNLQARLDQLKAEQEAMPKLAAFQGLGSLGEAGVYRPTTISGEMIQQQISQSPWLKMALEKQAAEQAQRMNLGAKQAQTSAAQARANIAMRGGLRGGAAERLGAQAGENLLLQRQNILGQGAVERGQLGMQGADLASKIAQQNVAAENAAREFNVKANIMDLAARENRALREYEEQMKLKGGEAAAKAQSSGGKK